jgi:hypothetical protein
LNGARNIDSGHQMSKDRGKQKEGEPPRRYD